jgi:TBC1 domain family member 2
VEITLRKDFFRESRSSIDLNLLQGYLPPKIERREETLTRKRDEYWSYVEQYYSTRTGSEHQETFRQVSKRERREALNCDLPLKIQKDIPRMNPLLAIFQQIPVQELFERVLFIWAIRHPASGYVQGINDLVTPFFLVFLMDLIDHGKIASLDKAKEIDRSSHIDIEIEKFDLCSLSESDRRLVEADSFWATSYLLEGIQDNYTFAQPGIQYKLRTLEELIKRIDGEFECFFCSIAWS